MIFSVVIYYILKMSCCGLSSTGLNNIDANELTADNITVFSNLNVSGYSFLNNLNVLINNNTTVIIIIIKC